jgi:ATP-dependent Clp protease protease subunit
MQDDFRKYAVSSGLPGTLVDGYHTHINSITPVIIDERKDNIAMIDVFSKLMSDRIIMLGTGINDYVANVMNAQLLYLNHKDPKSPITIYINSPGGSVYAGLGIYDTLKHIDAPIHTMNTGIAASMAAVLLAAGNNGERKSLTHARTMIHQPLGGAYGQASDIEITSKEILKLKKELYVCLANDTGQDIKKIEQDADRDYWMTAKEAKKYGLIDKISVDHPSKKPIRKKTTTKKTTTRKSTKK